ncbi:MAG: imidazole glycerol phosphate synthase subunit HisH [Carboxylicivirga sp.]|jgi:glutamine amidotransferase|nr:imidazole glycerol phosphate synthase subunit HisH [Carboxylicivirga sp.]
MITIIDYKAGNIRSIQNMLRKLGYQSQISDQASVISKANKLILPGVGSFDHGVSNLQRLGLWETIIDKVKTNIPILGICLGAQLMGKHSEEGQSKGFGFFDMYNQRFDLARLESHQKVPHMGWSHLDLQNNSLLLNNQSEDHRYYFVHSYHFVSNKKDEVIANCNYGYDFPCALEKDHIFAYQFHPEKSHKYGMEVLKKFAEL